MANKFQKAGFVSWLFITALISQKGMAYTSSQRAYSGNKTEQAENGADDISQVRALVENAKKTAYFVGRQPIAWGTSLIVLCAIGVVLGYRTKNGLVSRELATYVDLSNPNNPIVNMEKLSEEQKRRFSITLSNGFNLQLDENGNITKIVKGINLTNHINRRDKKILTDKIKIRLLQQLFEKQI